MKIKIIDLFNQIANDEVVPKIIWYNGDFYKYDKENKFYYNNNGISLYRGLYEDDNCLNDEAEIIESEITVNNQIEKLGKIYDGFSDSYYDTCLVKIAQKVDEIIDAVNKLKVDD